MPIDRETIPNSDFRDRAVPGLSDDPLPEELSLPDGADDGIEELEDGSAIVRETDPAFSSEDDFYENLAEVLPETELQAFSSRYLDLIEKDLEARKKRDETYEMGIRRTGLGDDAPGGAQFSGASKTVHPAMAEACIDFEASAIKELFPPQGPVKTYIIGEATKEDTERADRKRQYMNWQLTKQMPEYRPELERLLTQLPLGGSQYQKFRWVDRLKRPECEFVAVDNLIIPFSAPSFYSAQRITHRMFLTEMEFEERVADGLYRDITISAPSSTPDVSKAEKATEKIEGKSEDAFNEDGLRTDYEVHTWLKTSKDKDLLPYILTIDLHTMKVLALYRNWDPEDALRLKLDWFVDWTFIFWRGAMGIGLPHLIGGLSAALTGTLRALLDSAHIQNSATVIKLKGGRVQGQSTSIEVTEMKEIDAPPGVDDIRKVMMPIPFPGPSPVLFQLLGWLTDATKGVISTAEEKISDAGNNMPVGTAMALIESGSKVFSAIHGRLHAAHAKALEILHRLNGQYLDDHVEVADLGKLVVSRQDFLGSLDVIPVSDPAIFSETQRFSQIQALMQMQAQDIQDPNVPWNKVALRHRMMKLMHVQDIEELLPAQKGPLTADPVTENIACMRGQVLKAGDTQDHRAHILAHLQFICAPIHQMDSAPNPQLGALMGHVREHLLELYQDVAAQGTAQMIVQMQQGPTTPPGGLLQ